MNGEIDKSPFHVLFHAIKKGGFMNTYSLPNHQIEQEKVDASLVGESATTYERTSEGL